MRGIGHVYVSERNFRWMVAAGAAAVAAVSLSGPIDAGWWRVVTVTALVLAAELGNSALEAAVDLAEPNEHPLAAYAKDAAAGSVLLLSLFAAVVFVLELWPRLQAVWAGTGPVAWAAAVIAQRPVAAGIALGACALAGVGIWRYRDAAPRQRSEGG